MVAVAYFLAAIGWQILIRLDDGGHKCLEFMWLFPHSFSIAAVSILVNEENVINNIDSVRIIVNRTYVCGSELDIIE